MSTDKDDMVEISVLMPELFKTDFDDYAPFPFDKICFTFRFELSHFELKDEETGEQETYRFDYYQTKYENITYYP